MENKEEVKSVTLTADALEKFAADVASKTAEAIGRTKATSHVAGIDAAGPVVTGVKDAVEGTGIRFARIAKAQAMAKEQGRNVVDVLKGWGYAFEAKSVEKALQAGSSASGGALIAPEFSAELLPLLRNASFVRKAGARVLSTSSNTLNISRQNAASSASYIGEATAVTPSNPTADALAFSMKKLSATVAISNDMIRAATPDAEAWVRDDLVQVLALKEDYQAIFGVGSQYSPRGIQNLVASGQKFTITASDANAPTLAETKVGLAKLMQLVEQANTPMKSPAWFLNARSKWYLRALSESTGAASFLDAQLEKGQLFGFPVFCSEQIPSNLANIADSGSTYSRIIFGDASEFLMAEQAGMEIEAFPGGTYDNGSGTLLSGLSRDETVLRVIALHDFNIAHNTSFAVMATAMGYTA